MNNEDVSKLTYNTKSIMFISNHTKKIKFVPKSQSVIDNLKVERAVNA